MHPRGLTALGKKQCVKADLAIYGQALGSV